MSRENVEKVRRAWEAGQQGDLEAGLDVSAAEFHVIRETLDVIRPSDWAITGLFGLPPAT